MQPSTQHMQKEFEPHWFSGKGHWNLLWVAHADICLSQKRPQMKVHCIPQSLCYQRRCWIISLWYKALSHSFPDSSLDWENSHWKYPGRCFHHPLTHNNKILSYFKFKDTGDAQGLWGVLVPTSRLFHSSPQRLRLFWKGLIRCQRVTT